MSPWMRSDIMPDFGLRERCGNCGAAYEEHPVCRGCECDDKDCELRHCLLGGDMTYRPESDEDRIADRAGSMGL